MRKLHSKRAKDVLNILGIRDGQDLLLRAERQGFNALRIQCLKIDGCGLGTTDEIMDFAHDMAMTHYRLAEMELSYFKQQPFDPSDLVSLKGGAQQ